MHIIIPIAIPILGGTLVFTPPLGLLLTVAFVVWLTFNIWRAKRRRRREAQRAAEDEARQHAARQRMLDKAMRSPSLWRRMIGS